MLFAAVIAELVTIAPAALIVVPPAITVAPLIVPPLITGADKVLLVRVSTSVRVTMVPVVGYTAFEAVPVPPNDAGKMPVTAAVLDKLMAPNTGAPPTLGTVNTWLAVPTLVDCTVPVALPRTTAFAGMVLTPRPPLLRPNTPEIDDVGRVGMSLTPRVVPKYARPLLSTAILV